MRTTNRFVQVDRLKQILRMYRALPIMKMTNDDTIVMGAPHIGLAEELRQRIIDNVQEEILWMQRSRSKSMRP